MSETKSACAFLFYGIKKGHMRKLENFHCWNLWANHSKVKLKVVRFSVLSLQSWKVLRAHSSLFILYNTALLGAIGVQMLEWWGRNPPLYVVSHDSSIQRDRWSELFTLVDPPGRAALHPRRVRAWWSLKCGFLPYGHSVRPCPR